jgi:hypothetical protein
MVQIKGNRQNSQRSYGRIAVGLAEATNYDISGNKNSFFAYFDLIFLAPED